MTAIVNACVTFEHAHIKFGTSGLGENQQTYKWILYTLANVTQLGPVDCVQLNFKPVTDWWKMVQPRGDVFVGEMTLPL